MDDTKFACWRKSTRSSGGDNCVEVSSAQDGTVGVRDSKDPDGTVLEFRPAAWMNFVAQAKVETST